MNEEMIENLKKRIDQLEGEFKELTETTAECLELVHNLIRKIEDRVSEIEEIMKNERR